LEEEANQATQQWYHHSFVNTMILEKFHKTESMDLQTIPACVHPTAKLSRLEWAFEFYMFMFIIDDLVEHKTHASSLEDLEEFFLELMVVIISSFPEDHILKENLTKYFNDEIDHKSTKDFAKKYLRELCNILKQVCYTNDILKDHLVCIKELDHRAHNTYNLVL